MSVVTSIIITCSVLESPNEEDVFRAIDHINAYLRSDNRGEFIYLNGKEGGFKAWQIEVFGGAFNSLDYYEFAKALLSAPWVSPENVVLLVNGEDDECAREVRLPANHDGYNAAAATLQQMLSAHVRLSRQTN